MITQLKRLMLMVAAIAVVAVGCAPKSAPPTSVMDTPEYHYKNGLKYLDNDQIDEAMKSFDRAIALAPKSPLGYIGKGLAFGKKGDFKAAFENMDKAKGYEEKGIESRIGMIRLYSMQRSKDWIKDAEKEFKAASEKDPNNAALYYYMGEAYKVSFDFDKAADMFHKVLDLNKEFTGEANAEWAVIQKIQRAAPGTVIGKQIALIDKIDRADISALFVQEMDLEKLYTKRGPKTYDTTFKAPEETTTAFSPEKTVKMEPATDIENNWLKPSIDTVLKLHVRGLEAGPNHKFEPDKLITRAEFALMLEDILIKVSGDDKLATKYVGSPSLFPDVRSDYYAFNAIMVVTSRGFIEADKATGEFKPNDPVSGADALLSIREFKNQLKF
ncbi:MAG TPA: S-layer homology domain-containing protein [Nitrospirota bacterium]|nr:S-layer homology domain-containing protein [Nitrospirota bacterium]